MAQDHNSGAELSLKCNHLFPIMATPFPNIYENRGNFLPFLLTARETDRETLDGGKLNETCFENGIVIRDVCYGTVTLL